MSIYLSGPMSGIEEHNFPLFEHVTKVLRSKGLDIVSPHEINHPSDGRPETLRLRRDFRAMLDCDAIALLPGWTKSKGATAEVLIGTLLGFDFYHIVNAQDQDGAFFAPDQRDCFLASDHIPSSTALRFFIQRHFELPKEEIAPGLGPMSSADELK